MSCRIVDGQKERLKCAKNESKKEVKMKLKCVKSEAKALKMKLKRAKNELFRLKNEQKMSQNGPKYFKMSQIASKIDKKCQ